MTDCINAEMRDLLPDYGTSRLSAVEQSRLEAHLSACPACADELALLRTVRKLRPVLAPLDVGAIVARLPRPTVEPPQLSDPSIVSLESRRTHTRSFRGVWKLAATLGVILAGGWSVMMVRSGGIPSMQVQADSLPLIDIADGRQASTSVVIDTTANADPVTTIDATEPGAAVSFGGVGTLTDEELARVLDRLEKWDGATSTEETTVRPILASPLEGASR